MSSFAENRGNLFVIRPSRQENGEERLSIRVRSTNSRTTLTRLFTFQPNACTCSLVLLRIIVFKREHRPLPRKLNPL